MGAGDAPSPGGAAGATAGSDPAGDGTANARPSRRAIALAGLIALAVAMGIGRFAFTPLLPMMLQGGMIDLPGAGALASVNYLGYLAGALACTFQPWLYARLGRRPPDGPRWVRRGLVATALLTLGMALPWPAAWPVLRFAAGVVSAIVFVHCSGWCLAELARRGAPRLGGVMYAGPGAGIVGTGLCAGAMVKAHWPPAAGWAVFGALALALAAAVRQVVRTGASEPGDDRPRTAATRPVRGRASNRLEIAALALAYGLAGFGYIITATFLPVIARAALPGSPWPDLFWPVFGAGVCTGALLASRFTPRTDLRVLLAGCYATQAGGIGLGLVWPSPVGLGLGSLLLGLPFTVLTFYAMQEVRRLRPDDAPPTMGLLTAVYGLGQIVGPLLAAELLRRSTDDPSHGFELALGCACAVLVLGCLLYLSMVRLWPAAARAVAASPGPVVP